MNRLVVISFLFFIFQGSAYSYVDLSLSYTQSVQKLDGDKVADSSEEPGTAKTTSKGYTVNWAWYVWEYTAIELNYAETNERLEDNRKAATSSKTITIEKIDSSIVTKTQGIGIQQRFANRKARFIPSIALGYAKYTTSGKVKYDILNGGVKDQIDITRDKVTKNSAYVTMAFKIRFSQFLGLTLSAKSVMPDADTSKAANNLTYSAGMSWVF